MIVQMYGECSVIKCIVLGLQLERAPTVVGHPWSPCSQQGHSPVVWLPRLGCTVPLQRYTKLFIRLVDVLNLPFYNKY
jgi:hypothetical protein